MKKSQHRSPWRYPGGKFRATEHLGKFLPKEMGAAHFEVYVANELGIPCIGCDGDLEIVNVWWQLLTEPNALADKLSTALPKFDRLQGDAFYCLRDRREELDDPLDFAAAAMIVSSSSCSGSPSVTGYSRGHKRFTKSRIEMVRHFKFPLLRVEHADFRESMPLHRGTPCYADPPYVLTKDGSELYPGHREFPHEDLAELMHQHRAPFLLSYADHPLVRFLYSSYRIVDLEGAWSQGMPNSRKGPKVLIISDDIVVPDGYKLLS